jgi:hypothetical protein
MRLPAINRPLLHPPPPWLINNKITSSIVDEGESEIKHEIYHKILQKRELEDTFFKNNSLVFSTHYLSTNKSGVA